jgi:hypothetical protein
MKTRSNSKYSIGSKTYSYAVRGEVDRQIAMQPKDIPGWGIDADAKNNPTYPMKNYTGADFERIHYERAIQQEVTVDVFQSIERPSITRVFGTSTPPRGLSGLVRRFAFKFSEADARHWLSLILADRVNVVEGIIDDLRHGHVPNFFAERGWRAEWKYNRKGAMKRIAIGAAIASIAIGVLVHNRRTRRASHA